LFPGILSNALRKPILISKAYNKNKKKIKKGKKGPQTFYFAEALNVAPHLGHLYRPTVKGFLPLGAIVHVFCGFATSVPHFGHFAIFNASMLS
jgi:hypothetical protein